MADELLEGDPALNSVETGEGVDAALAPVEEKKIVAHFKDCIEAAKSHKKTFLPRWKSNVDARLGQPSSGGWSDEEGIQSEINPDWALTKTKTANLYSQVPSIQITHENKKFARAIPPFAKALNYELGEKRANIGVAMEEALNDVVNAAGVAAIIVGYAARFETVEVPAIDVSQFPPELQQELQGQIPMVPVQRVVSDKFYGTRISPTCLLWPKEFKGSCFDDGPWIGHEGRLSWAEAKNEFKLREEDKEQVLGGSGHDNHGLRNDSEKTNPLDIQEVSFTELFYWRYKVDPEEKSFQAIWRLVLVDGLEEPAVHEAWQGQKYDEQSRAYVGNCKFPVRVLTLTYVSDNPVPPSDTEAGRPQVKDMRLSRNQMFQNRAHSVPVRWYDVNRFDPEIQELLRRGRWQGFIPTNGDGTRSVGEIARASYPGENLTFDRTNKADLMETWQIGPNQMGSQGASDQTKAEVDTVQANFATRIGQERARVASFFLSVAEVMAGWMVLYSDFKVLSDEERQQMQEAWDSKHILHDLVLKIRPDSSLVLDTSQRIQRLTSFLNMTAKSGFINVPPILAELAELAGLDPAEVLIKPDVKVEEPNISYRFSGKEDMINPLVLAMLIEKKQAPSIESIQAAMKLLDAAASGLAQQAQMAGQPQQPGQPPQAGPPSAGPGGPPGPPQAQQPSAPSGSVPSQPGPPPGPSGSAGAPPQAQQPPAVPANPFPNWTLGERISKRSDDIRGS